MVKCTFCGDNIEQGTGKILALNSGEVRNYCSNKCEKNHVKLRRDPKNIKWTQSYKKGAQ